MAHLYKQSTFIHNLFYQLFYFIEEYNLLVIKYSKVLFELNQREYHQQDFPN